MKLCSACLLGIPCRFDWKSKPNPEVLELAQKEVLIPVCPEQLWWLCTPRSPCEIKDWKVIDIQWTDKTQTFLRWAEIVLDIAKMYTIKEAILKQKSPSCWCWKIYDWSFTGTLIDWNGITADLLIQNWIKVISEEDLTLRVF